MLNGILKSVIVGMEEIVTEPEKSPQPYSYNNLGYVVVGLVFLVVGGIMGLAAGGALVTRADVEAIVRQVLAETTVKIDDSALQASIAQISAAPGSGMNAADVSQLVMEALAQQEAARLAEERVRLVDDDPYQGTADAPLVIVEFSAYACPYCGRHFQETLQPLLDNYGQYIRYVYRDFPVINEAVSFPAAMAAQCADEQDQFWQFHDVLFRNQDKLGRDFYLQTAGNLSLDVDAFTACIDENRYQQEVLDDYYAGDDLGISGTPTFWINGEIVSGALPYARFEQIILRKLQASGITVGESG